MNISAAGNTEVPGILAIERLGYKLSCTSDGSEWRAEKDGSCFSANSPLELLGLIEMYSSRGVDWKANDLEIERCVKQYIGLGGRYEDITPTNKSDEQE